MSSLLLHLHWNELNPSTPLLDVRGTVHGSGHVAHRHDFHELVLVVDGSADHRTLDGVQRIGAGHLLWVPLGEWHAYERCDALDIRMWLLHPDLLEGELPCLTNLEPWATLLGGHGRGVASGRVRAPAGVRGLVERWGRMRRHQRGWSQPEARLRLYAELLALLAEVGAALTPTLREAPRRFTHPAVVRATRLLHARFREDWTVAAVAAESGGLHPTHFMRVFREQTGETVLGFLERRRLRHAANLLRGTTLTVTEIAGRCGFDDSNYFARRFRRAHGTTPREFREGGEVWPCPPARPA